MYYNGGYECMGASPIVSNEYAMKILAENEKSGKHSPTLF
jgi:hypothetical protein